MEVNKKESFLKKVWKLLQNNKLQQDGYVDFKASEVSDDLFFLIVPFDHEPTARGIKRIRLGNYLGDVVSGKDLKDQFREVMKRE